MYTHSSSPPGAGFAYNNKKRTIYEVLGVDNSADEESVKRAYHQLALRYHPDRNKHDGNAEKAFKEIVEAYEILRSPDRRLLYDRDAKCVTNHDLSEAKLSRSPSALFEAVDQFFTKSGYVSPTIQGLLSTCKRKIRGRTLRTTLYTTFQETVFGCLKTAEITRISYCTYCKGTGEVPTVDCGVASNGIAIPSSNVPRRHCSGCGGTGRLSTNKGLQIEVPAGVKKGEELVYEGEGDVGDFGAPAGDLVIIFDTQEHPVFKRDGDDVVVEFVISFAQASLGATVHIPSLYGMMDIGVPSGTQPNDVLRVTDQGFYNFKTKRRGNMLLRLNIKIPSALTEEQRILLEQFMQTENKNNSNTSNNVNT